MSPRLALNMLATNVEPEERESWKTKPSRGNPPGSCVSRRSADGRLHNLYRIVAFPDNGQGLAIVRNLKGERAIAE